MTDKRIIKYLSYANISSVIVGVGLIVVLVWMFINRDNFQPKNRDFNQDTNSVSLTSSTSKNIKADISNADKKKDSSFYQKNFRKINLDEHIGTKTLKQYLADDKIPKKFKTIFQSDGTKLNDDDETLSLIDSLFSKDKERHPFYFVLVTRTMWWADCGFADLLGMQTKIYVEKETKQFLNYFKTEKVLTDADFNNWAEAIAMEIRTSIYEPQEIENVKLKMINNCADCSADDIKLIDKFVATIKKYSP